MLGKSIIPLVPIDGGLNTNSKPWLIGTSESQKCVNFDIGREDSQGSLIKRNGYIKDNTTQYVTGVTTSIYRHDGTPHTHRFASQTGSETLVHSWLANSGMFPSRTKYRYVRDTANYLVSHHSGSKFYYTDYSGATVGITATLGVNTVWFQTFSGTMYMTSADIAMKEWNGGAIANTAGTPPSNADGGLEVYANRLWTAKDNTLSSSALNNASDWTTVNNSFSTTVGNKNTDKIRRIISQGSRLLIFKENLIYALYGNAASNFYVELLTELTGIASPRSAVCIDGTVFFRGRDGVYVLTERATTPEFVSQKIKSKFDEQTNTTSCCGMIYKDQYWLTYTNQSVTDGVLVLYYKLGKWAEYRGMPNEALYSYVDIPYGGKNGRVYTLETGLADDGSGINIQYKSPALAYGDLSKDKQFDKTYVSALTNGTHTLSVDHYVDFVSKSDTKTIPLMVDTTGQLLVTEKLNWGQGAVGKLEEIEISETSTYSVEIFGITSYATVLEDK